LCRLADTVKDTSDIISPKGGRMKESTRDEFYTLAEQKRSASNNNPIWVSIAEKLDQNAPLGTDELDALGHEALKKIAYLREQKEKGRESATIKLHLLTEAYHDLYGELPI
jgi:hypothetical protein